MLILLMMLRLVKLIRMGAMISDSRHHMYESYSLFQGYEYFGYDPLTYYSNEACAEEAGSFHLEDNREEELEVGEEFDEEEKQREPVLEIDLDEVENCKAEVRQGKDRGRDILCK